MEYDCYMIISIFDWSKFGIEIIACSCFAFFVEFKVSWFFFTPEVFDCELLASIAPYIKNNNLLHFRPQFIKSKP